MAPLTVELSPVEEALRRHPLPSIRRLGVEETPAAITLTGTVSSYYLKQLAQEAVLPLLAGRELLNRVAVVAA